MKKPLIFIALSTLLASCATLPKSYQTQDEVIAVGPGPEDAVVDTISEQPRLLISCNARRKNDAHYGEIMAYYLKDGSKKLLTRTNEPKNLLFTPHGIDLVMVKDSLILLVVNHEHEQHINSILRYKVEKDKMFFLNKITDPLITSPNAVTGLSDGTILISNDSKKPGQVLDMLFKVKKAEIVYWNGSNCSVASKKYCYSNGITNSNGKVYLASTLQNKVWSFDFKDGKMINREVIAKVKGGDNIRFNGNNLIVPCHLRSIAFLKHMGDSTKLSPTTVYSINPVSKKTEVIFFDSGKQLSAGSTSVAYNGYLYTVGVFDAKMDKKKLK